jgi:hypothetical protein
LEHEKESDWSTRLNPKKIGQAPPKKIGQAPPKKLGRFWTRKLMGRKKIWRVGKVEMYRKQEDQKV